MVRFTHSRRFLWLIAGIGLAVILGTAWSFFGSRAASNRCNVVLVTLDTTRADHIGCYGYLRGRTPALDALAERGVLFERAYRIKLASALTHLGRPREAIPELEATLDDNPHDVPARLELGTLLMQIGQMREAVPHFEAVLKIQPARTLARLNLASALAHERHFADAVAHARKSIEDDPQRFEPRYTLAVIFLTQNRYPEAIAELEEACRLRPDDVPAREQLQRAQAALALQKPASVAP